ncbi:hypothetical protein QCA50_014730 [Cerrena zonata]|uniref:Uncharacterized protein n=1 Tax=Cerrena zonata TaxID=2478898 RepID=A0AAW0FX10_9APHY
MWIQLADLLGSHLNEVFLDNFNDIPKEGTPNAIRASRPVLHFSRVQDSQEADFANYSATQTDFKHVAIFCLFDVLFLLRVAKWKKDYAKTSKFERTEQLPYYKGLRPGSAMKEAAYAVITSTFGQTPFENTAKAVVDKLLATETTSDIAGVMPAIAKLHEDGLQALDATELATFRPLGGDFTNSNPDKEFNFRVSDADSLDIRWPTQYGPDLVGALVKLAQNLRDDQKDPSFLDFVAFHFGYLLLSQGENLPTQDIRFLGTPGFRKDFQTYLSLTDPGDGHIHGTTRKSRWMKGAIVHVEYLERPKDPSSTQIEGETKRPEVETYRISSILDFALVRLHTGSEAPNSMFIGRVMRDSKSGDFSKDFIKVVGTTAAAVTGLLSRGSAECKIAMEGLTTRQMVDYMQTLKANVSRKPTQYLSAAFNINTTMIDDLVLVEGEKPRVLKERMDIALRGIVLAAMGGFDKVTFDGAALVYPSVPFTEQLTSSQALRLVHEAHSVGLTTYFSAGFKFENIKDAIYTGVDGIGIGGAQVLRYMDHDTGMHGPYTEENIDRIMVERSNAENSIRGRSARLLARLDQMHFEGSLKPEEVVLRHDLYKALSEFVPEDTGNLGEPGLYALLEDRAAKDILAFPDDGEKPMLGYARRISRSDNVVLRQATSDKDWEKFKNQLKQAVANDNERGVRSMYATKPWVELRAGYRKAIDENHKYFRGEPDLPVKQPR